MLAWLLFGCPNCDGHHPGPTGGVVEVPRARLAESEDGEGLVCSRCSVVIEPRQGRWRFPAECCFRPLPGLLGLLFRDRPGRAA